MKRLLLVLILCSVSLGQYWKPPLGTLPDWGESINRGTVGWWVMNEGIGSHINDISLNGNHGTLVGDTTWAGGQFGPALSFDGAGDYVDLGNTNYNLGSGGFTVSSFFNVGPGDDIAILDTGTGGPTFAYIIITSSVAQNHIGIDDGSTRVVIPHDPTGWKDNNWHLLVFLRGPVDIELYIDGIFIDSANVSSLGSVDDGRLITRIGQGWASYHTGLIDHVKIYNRVLTLGEIQQLSTMPFKGLPHD